MEWRKVDFSVFQSLYNTTYTVFINVFTVVVYQFG